jgi:hypothetical protein
MTLAHVASNFYVHSLHDVPTGQNHFPEHNGLTRRGLLGGTSGWGPSTGAGEVRGADGWVPDPPGHDKPDYALENESPVGRGAGGCQVVLAYRAAEL